MYIYNLLLFAVKEGINCVVVCMYYILESGKILKYLKNSLKMIKEKEYGAGGSLRESGN